MRVKLGVNAWYFQLGIVIDPLRRVYIIDLGFFYLKLFY